MLKLALAQINEHTDIIADYDQVKTGRKVTGISFHFKHKPTAKPIATDTPAADDGYIKMSADQIATFSAKLANVPALGSNAPMGASTADYATLIAEHLADKDKQARYLPHLEKLGFKTAKAKSKAA